ncbi:MAG: Asparagine synthetase (glutamine-hydrolyzing) 1 [Pelotomaculum sp. PtaU1.Bin065]|nr:MAG: Asparagine synthetase (glutamine-hydrolyzing) 1 [Pelotomaculum sp. PtaU1.Bin065]
MCGFVGIINFNNEPVSKKLLIKMRDIMFHRGPDDEGLYLSDYVGLGFRRLSIIDLSTGHQPMQNADGSIWVVFNGEIYNYLELRESLEKTGRIFKTMSDTEVILHLYEVYGNRFIEKLNGMFSFVIWDEKKREIFAARDRIGIKPFYYYFDDHRLIIASEIKAILEDHSVRREPNYQAIIDYLNFMYVLGDKTFFRCIKKLLPGHTLRLTSDGKLEIKQYWDLTFSYKEKVDESVAATKLLEMLQDSVRIHLRSDVPLGCHLSGGLDSSSITCLAASLYKAENKLNTFSGKFNEDSFYDETPYAKLVAGHVGSQYHEIIPDGEPFPEVMEKISWFMDEPAVGPGIYPQYFICKLASQHVKVVLGGQGGDELFGGYPRYFLTAGLAGFSELSNASSQSSSNAIKFSKLNFLMGYIKRRGLKRTAQKTIQYLKVRSEGYREKWKRFSTTMAFNESLLGPVIFPTYCSYDVDSEFFTYIDKENASDVFDKLLYHDFKCYLPALLQVEDRTSMAFSLESRVPMLDYRLAELAASLPHSLKVKMGEPKYILKQAVRGIVPQEILDRKDKKGFPTPINYWFKNNLTFYLKSMLLDKRSSERGVFNPEAVRRMINSRDDNSWELWTLLNVELWFRNFID